MNLSAFPLVALAAAVCVTLPATGAELSPAKPVQTVLISFDGAHDNAQWRRSLALGEKTGAKFTYFLNCVFLLAPENKAHFKAPGFGGPKSNVGYGKSKSDVSARLLNVWRAHVSGHEIASHTCGHLDGKSWTAADWLNDLAQFRSILANAWAINGDPREPLGWRAFSDHFPSGFRAPYLSTGPGLEQALRRSHFLYDASGVERGISEPKLKSGVLHFALPTIPEGPTGRRVILMDYNLFVRHSGGTERTDTDGAFEKRTLDALYAAFNEQYSGERHPLQYGLHFTLMNSGAYWRALETFASDVCRRRDVRCTSYQDYAERFSAEKAVATAAKRGGS
jgi:peptidoglycan/xylan/chitin deacetylase (PgdA/CDA1 family)